MLDRGMPIPNKDDRRIPASQAQSTPRTMCSVIVTPCASTPTATAASVGTRHTDRASTVRT